MVPGAPPPPPTGPYSHAVRAGDFLFVTGELPAHPETGQLYLVNFADYPAMNAVYASYFAPGRLPGRTCVGVTGLALGAFIEIDLVVRP